MHGKVGFGKDEMCSYKHTHNSAVHTTGIGTQTTTTTETATQTFEE